MSAIRQVHVRLRSVYTWCAFSFVMFVALLAAYAHEHGGREALRMPRWSLLVILPAFYVHELIHIAGLRAVGLRAQDVGVRMSWRYLMLHAQIRVPVEVRLLRLSTVLPLFVIGILPALTGALMASRLVYMFGIAMILGCGGDLAVLNALRAIPAGTRVVLRGDWDGGAPDGDDGDGDGGPSRPGYDPAHAIVMRR